MPPIPAVKFKFAKVTPPKISHQTSRPSPYAPPEMVPGMWDALRDARVAATKDPKQVPWVQFIDGPLPSEQSARNALKRIREAVVAHAGLADVKTIAARTWHAEGDEAKWYFSLSVRPGVLNDDGTPVA